MNTRPCPAGERWRKRIDRQSSSGLSVAAFCRRHSIAVATFYFWKRRLAEPGHSSAFVEVHSPRGNDAASSGETRRSIALCLRGGRRLRMRRGFDRQLLLDVLAALEGES